MFEKYRNVFAVIIGLLIIFMNFNIYAASSLREYRTNLLNEIGKDAKILEGGRICRSKHFALSIGVGSMGDFGLNEGEKLQDLMFRICFIFEEAYQLLGEYFDRSPSGRFEINLYSRERYDRGGGKGTSGSISRSGVSLPLEAALMKDHLDDFSEGISQIYYAYARMFLYAIIDPSFYTEAAPLISEYFQKVGEETSSWKGPITEEKRNSILNSIDAEYSSLFEKYPEYFENRGPEKKFITCKWCGKKVDVTGKRKGKRIMCPYCRSLIYVE